VVVWHCSTGQRLATLKGHTAAAKCCAFSPTAPALATVAQDGSLRLWDLASACHTTQAGPKKIGSTHEGQPPAVACLLPKSRGRAVPAIPVPKSAPTPVAECSTVQEWSTVVRAKMAKIFSTRAVMQQKVAECDDELGRRLLSSNDTAKIGQLYDDAIEQLKSQRVAKEREGTGAIQKKVEELDAQYAVQVAEARQLNEIIPLLQEALANPSTSTDTLLSLEAAVDSCLALRDDDFPPSSTLGPQLGEDGAEWMEMISSPPEAPAECSVPNFGPDWIQLAWVPPASAYPIERYEVRQLGPDNAYLTVQKTTGSVTMCTATDLEGGTRYVFGVRACNAKTAGPWRNVCGSTSASVHCTSRRFAMDQATLEGNSFGTGGILYWIGTKEGQDQTWYNPLHSHDMDISASSKAGGQVRNIVARNAAKFCTEDEEGSWIGVEFLKYQVQVSGYAMRVSQPCGQSMQQGVKYSPRHWVLEGLSEAGWSVIHSHQNDDSLCSKDQAAWDVNNQGFYTHFRVRLTGPNARRTEGGRNRLAIAGIEFFGSIQPLM